MVNVLRKVVHVFKAADAHNRMVWRHAGSYLQVPSDGGLSLRVTFVTTLFYIIVKQMYLQYDDDI